MSKLIPAFTSTGANRQYATSIVAPDSGIGYAEGGAAVTQATDRSTAVSINALCGAITTDDASLAAAAEATFTVTNPRVAAGDVIAISKASGGTSIPVVSAVAAGSFAITLTNLHASDADTTAMVINFAVIKAVNA